MSKNLEFTGLEILRDYFKQMGGKEMLLFQPDGITYINKEKETVLDAARKAGVLVESPCGGNGTCGKCRVKVLVGEVNAITEEEKHFFTEQELQDGWRLACKLVPKHFRSCEVEVPNINLQMDSEKEAHLLYESELKKYEKKIKECLQEEEKDGKREKETMHGGSRESKADCVEKCASTFGIAVDIGTTNMEFLLWGLENKRCVGRKIAENPLKIYGADVVARMTYALKHKENFKESCSLLRNTIATLMEELLQTYLEQYPCKKSREIENENMGGGTHFSEQKVDNLLLQNMKEKVSTVSVVGNAAMMHFLAEVNPESLTRAPYKTKYKDSVSLSGTLFGLLHASVRLFPNIEGFVGADTVGVLAYLKQCREEKEGMTKVDDKAPVVIKTLKNSKDISKWDRVLMIDIGTNGELVLQKEGRLYAASTAAGPAFEGATISCGMRGEVGAIRGMQVKEKIELDVIGEVAPRGICGSGLISVVAELVNFGIIDETGYLLNRNEAIKQGCPKVLVDCLEIRGRETVFAISDMVILTQQDIRELQLAKGAISAGITMLLQACKMNVCDLRGIVLAGAFGTHLQVDAAQRIGLLPDMEKKKIVPIGNAALLGAGVALFYSEEKWRALNNLAHKVQHISLAEMEGFQEVYLEAMGFAKVEEE